MSVSMLITVFLNIFVTVIVLLDDTTALISHHLPGTNFPTASMISVPPPPPRDGDVYSTPTQAEDNDDDVHNPFTRLATGNTEIRLKNRQLESIEFQKQALESQRGVIDVEVHQSNRHHLEEKELQHRRELEQKEVELQRHQAALQEREETINQITQQYEHQLHLLRQVKSESGSEKERLQQQIREYEHMLRQNNEQIEILRRENQQGPALIGPVGEKYHMDKTPHGIAVIINNSVFHSAVPTEDPLPERRGSQVDEDNLRVTWDYLRYDVRILKNLTASELTRQLMQIALQNHEKYDSFVCCILSHGYLDGVYGTDSKPVKINDIASLFKGTFCPTLADKPKLFFIQACRGDDEDRGVVVQKDAKGDSDDAFRHSLPSEADFLFGYATPPGNVSWRSPRYGSWYISKLCEVFVDYAPQQDLLSMLTIVNHKVSEAYTTQGYKQCPAPVTLLRKQVWFFGNNL